MATPQNDSSVRLYATVPRNINPALNNALILAASTTIFQTSSGGGVGNPTIITFNVSRIGLTEAVTWNVTNCSLTTSGDTATLAFTNMVGSLATVSVSLVRDGVTYTSNVCNITKVADGAAGSNGTPGTNGARGAGHFYIVGNPWTDALADSATPGANVVDDVVTVYTNGVYVLEKRWDGTNWVAQGSVVDGNLLVTGTVQTAALAAYAVKASKISITTSGGTLNNDPNFVDYPNSWDTTGSVNLAGAGGSAPAVTYVGSTALSTGVFAKELIPIDSTKTYTLGASIYNDPGNDRLIILYIQFYNAVGTRLTPSPSWGDTNYSGFTQVFAPTAGDWYPYRSGKFGANPGSGLNRPIPAAAKYCRIGVIFNAGGGSATGKLMGVTSFRLEELTPGVLIQDGAITAEKITVTSLAAIKAELGSAVISTTGSLRSGMTDYATGSGWWLGFSGGLPKFSIGDGTYYFRWTGSTIELKLPQITLSALADLNSPSGANGTRIYGTRTITASSGTAPYSYVWSLVSSDGVFISGGGTTATVQISGTGTNIGTSARVICTVTDANGLSAVSGFNVNATHGTPP